MPQGSLLVLLLYLFLGFVPNLPGFYYDAEKNRYFPIKGPIPGSSSSSARKPIANPKQEINLTKRVEFKIAKLLQVRELYGNVISSSKRKCNFQEEYQKSQASQPLVWKYKGTDRVGDGALEQIHVDVNMPNGVVGTDILLAGSLNGSLSLYEVGKVSEQFDYGVKCMPNRIRPINMENQARCAPIPGNLWRPVEASLQMPSSISCVKTSGKLSTCEVDDVSFTRHILITTLGSESSGGSVYVLNLSEPIEYNPSIPIMRRRMCDVATFSCTVWTADCNTDGSQAVIGTNLGAAMVNLETGMSSWVCRCKSDILSVHLDISGNIVLCGLRNGAIVTVDARQKPEGSSARLARHHIPYPHRGNREPSDKSARNSSKQRFELKGSIDHSRNTFMPSSISCLAPLKLYDQYFMASSMDGSINLYDHRLIQRGAIQSYDGNVNSHTRTQLGIDPSERILLSGGEDCYLRLWSIKSGEMLFEDKFMNSIPSVVCWPRTEGLSGVPNERQNYREYLYGQNDSSGVWLGSQEGLFYMQWP